MSDLDDLLPPPRRPLPREVRNRMRATVLGGIRTPSLTRTHRVRPPLAVAAGVAVLALGVTILTQSLAGPHGIPTGHRTTQTEAPGTPPALNLAAAATDMDRCWKAVANAGRTDGVPARSTWLPVFAVPDGDGATVTAVRADGKPLICETTRTTVTVSNPNASPAYGPGSLTGALLDSADGFVAGVVDPGWTAMQFVAVGKSGASNGGPGFYQDGMFVDIGGFAPGGRYTVRQTVPGAPPPEDMTVSPAPDQPYPELKLPAAPAPLVATVDRPDPPTDRTSVAGRFLAECIAQSDNVVIDPDSWQPLVMGGTSPNTYVLARSGNEMATCSTSGVRFDPNNLNDITILYDFESSSRRFAAKQPLRFAAGGSFATDASGSGQSVIILGVVDPTVSKLTITAPGGTRRSVPIAHGTFTTQFAGVSFVDADNFTALLQDRTGRTLYSGKIDTGF
jgi:hypothetical protein